MATATAVAIALSPAFAPAVAWADTETGTLTVSSPVIALAGDPMGVVIPFDAKVTHTASGATYEYVLSVQNAANTGVDLSAAKGTVTDSSGANVAMSVYGTNSVVQSAPIALPSGADVSGAIQLQLPAGQYTAQVSVVDASTGASLATVSSIPVSVESGTVSSASGPSVSVSSGNDVNVSVTTNVYNAASGDAYTYNVQLFDGTTAMDLSSQGATASEGQGANLNPSFDPTGTTLSAQSTALTGSNPSATATFNLGSLSDGNYTAAISVVNSVCETIGSATIPITVGSASTGGGTGGTSTGTLNIAGTVLQSNSSTPVGQGTLDLQGSNGIVHIPVDANGTFNQAGLAADVYNIVSYTTADGHDVLPVWGTPITTSASDLNVSLAPLMYLDPMENPTNVQPATASTLPITLTPATVTNAVYLTATIAASQSSTTDTGSGATTGGWTALSDPSVATLTATIGGQTVAFNWNTTQNAYVSNPFTIPTGATSLPLTITFARMGNYVLSLSLTDAVNGLQLGGEGTQLTVGGATVTGGIYAADNTTPIAGGYVMLQDQNGIPAWATTDGSGQFSTQLLDGTWTVQGIYLKDGSATSYSDASTAPQIVVTNGQVTNGPIRIVDANTLIGTAYADDKEQTPLANTYLSIQANSSQANSSTTGTEPSGLVTDANGKFVSAGLPDGSYTVTSEWSETTGQYTQTSIPFTVKNGTTVIAPQPNNYDLTVEDSLGKLVSAGSSLIVEAGTVDSANPNWQNALWLTVDANGHAQGYLPTGTYTVIGISTPDNYYPISGTTFAVSDTGVATQTISPPQPLVSGTLMQGTTPIPNGTIVVEPAGSTDWSQAVYLSTDPNGKFTDDGWNPATNVFGDMLSRFKDYTITGAWDQSGTWYPLNQDLSLGDLSVTTTVYLPTPDVTGSVTVDGSPIQNGWVSFDAVGDTTGSAWQWTSIQNGTYGVNLPQGTYNVMGVGDTQGNYHDVQSSGTTVTVSDTNALVTANLNFTNNFTGTLVSNSVVAFATMMLSPVENPQTQSDWSQVQYVSTDANGAFEANLNPSKSWYLVGVWSQDTGYRQMAQSVNVQANQTISIANNALATVTFANSAPSTAYLVVTDANGNSYNAEGQASTSPSNQMTFGYTLSAGTYAVAGIVTEDAAGNETWTDLNSKGLSITAAQNGGPQPLSIDLSASYHGLVSGWTAGQSGYVVFQKTVNGSTQMTSVPFDNTGAFTTVFDNSAGWQVAAIETSSSYATAHGLFQNGTWTVNQGL